MYGRDRVPRNPWKRAFVEITCNDTNAAAEAGDEDAQELDDEMRGRNIGNFFVYARPGDNLWKLGLEVVRSYIDRNPEPDLYTCEFGHA